MNGASGAVPLVELLAVVLAVGGALAFVLARLVRGMRAVAKGGAPACCAGAAETAAGGQAPAASGSSCASCAGCPGCHG